MHILIDLIACQTQGSRYRGIGRYSLSLARAMVQLAAPEHQVSLLLSDRFPDSLPELHRIFSPLVGDANIHVIALPADVHQSQPGCTVRGRIAEKLRSHAIAQIKPDIVHVSSLFEGLDDDTAIAIEPPGSAAIPTVVTLYDLIPYLRQDVYLADTKKRCWYYRRLQSLQNADMLLAISESSREEAITALGMEAHRVINISSAIDEQFRPIGLTPAQVSALRQRFGLQRDMVMYTGGIDYRKNIAGLIAAYARMPAGLRQSHQLVIVCNVGPGDQRHLLAVAQQEGMAPGELVLTGYVPDADLLALYNLAKLFVFPSLHEGFGLPVLEAMACGTPAIGSNASSIPEVIGRPDALFDPTDPQSITAAMVGALSSTEFLSDLRQHGLQRARLFSWEQTARRVLASLQDLVNTRTVAQSAAPAQALHSHHGKRPRLAYFSPLPPDRSGIADYSAEFIPELARHYDIELITDNTTVTDDVLQANFPTRSTEWFERNASRYQRVLYHMGNSHFHLHMLPLLRRYPGAVVLHDYYLSGMLRHAEITGAEPHALRDSIYRSHGYKGLAHWACRDPVSSVMAYAANRSVLDFALGVLVHSGHSIGLAEQDYGADYAQSRFMQVPFARKTLPAPDKALARQKLGIDAAAFVVCSFGFMAPTKLNLELIEAWSNSQVGRHSQARLIFVGQVGEDDYGNQVRQVLKNKQIDSGPASIQITGYVTAQDYALWLAAADVGVQLRTQSRGETSAAVFDCLAGQLPLIYNAHGSAAELPADIAFRLSDPCQVTELAQALDTLHSNPVLRQQLARQGAQHIHAYHRPASAARACAQAIETIYRSSALVQESELLQEVAATDADQTLAAGQIIEVAACIARNRRNGNPPRLLIDITPAQPSQLRGLLAALVAALPQPWQLECVRQEGQSWTTDRALACSLLGISAQLPEEPVLVHHQDAWLCLAKEDATSAASFLPALFAHKTAHLAGSGADAPMQDAITAIVSWLQSTDPFHFPLMAFVKKLP